MATFWLSFITHGDPNPTNAPPPLDFDTYSSYSSSYANDHPRGLKPNPNLVGDPKVRNSVDTVDPQTADPQTADSQTAAPTVWSPYTRAQDNNLVFALQSDGGVKMESNYRQQQCDYWDTLPGGPDR